MKRYEGAAVDVSVESGLAGSAVTADNPGGLLLRRWRLRTRQTLRDLAAVTGVPPSTLSAYETGRTPITVDRLAQIVHVSGAAVTISVDIPGQPPVTVVSERP